MSLHQRPLHINHYINSIRRQPLVFPERFTNKAAGAIALDGVSDLSGCGDTDASPVILFRKYKRREVSELYLAALFVHAATEDALQAFSRITFHGSLVVRRCKSRTTLGATPLEYQPAAFCTHTHAKAVSLSPAAVVGLKGPLHVFYAPL